MTETRALRHRYLIKLPRIYYSSLQSSFFFSAALFFSPSIFLILVISFPISLLSCLWRAGLYPIPKRSSRCTKNGARTTAGSPTLDMYLMRYMMIYVPPNKLSSRAGARFSASPCPKNWAIQETPWSIPALVIASL